jgi:hypothetical protein
MPSEKLATTHTSGTSLPKKTCELTIKEFKKEEYKGATSLHEVEVAHAHYVST